MEDKKKSIEEVLPKEKLDQLDKYPDHLESPLNDLESKKDTLEKAEQAKNKEKN